LIFLVKSIGLFKILSVNFIVALNFSKLGSLLLS
jgi:nitrate reductase NapE component